MRRPIYQVFVTQESQPDLQGEKNTWWTKVGVAFAHHGKPGLNVVLTPGIAVSGKLVLLEPRDDGDATQDTEPV
ncbi:TPA: hypothetical protein PXR14_003335 [Yersinia enterocolitica]|uniref:hypothetical protein n=1 Tax=Enterobacterales TaxID=91347 RepID=UPI00065CF375|nr:MULTISPECIES: hypothetical protein [Enterobacterales]AZP51509.1 hypothetical protein EJP80_13665 [Rahnella aquatilis]EKN4754951.1 hypothetical protein [Yersinia enterocolitica]VTQ53153.1 Uncharacterised protein [Campylobacter jejuni]EKN5148938.1 hypothetical protein [Yersinia enterocolitica]MEB7598295.1 hypothetical protein [Raoultella terrigena]